MSVCKECESPVAPGKTIVCSGACGHSFHQSCVLNKTQIAAWSARVGLIWLCASCRLTFDVAVYDRDKVIMKALRELLIRMDSMDIRLGVLGENLRKVNHTIYSSKQQQRDTGNRNKSFMESINELNLDTTTDTLNRSRSCDETSFFEVIDEINTSIANVTERFMVGGGRRVQIKPRATSSTVNSTISQQNPNPPSPEDPATTSSEDSETLNNHDSSNNEVARSGLRVANREQPIGDEEAFYVTPFEPDESEDVIKRHVCKISNCEPSQVKVVKLVPRGKNPADLTYVSFKITVPKYFSRRASKNSSWPGGVTVRPFEFVPKNGRRFRTNNQK